MYSASRWKRAPIIARFLPLERLLLSRKALLTEGAVESKMTHISFYEKYIFCALNNNAITTVALSANTPVTRSIITGLRWKHVHVFNSEICMKISIDCITRFRKRSTVADGGIR